MIILLHTQADTLAPTDGDGNTLKMRKYGKKKKKKE